MTIYILSERHDTVMANPRAFMTLSEANAVADTIMEEALREGYEEETGKPCKKNLSQLVDWAENNGYGDSRYFWCGRYGATELMVTTVELEG